MTKDEFVAFWEKEIFQTRPDRRDVYKKIKGNSGSNNPIDHLWALLNEDYSLRIKEMEQSLPNKLKINEILKRNPDLTAQDLFEKEFNDLNGFHMVRLGRFLEMELSIFESDRTSSGEIRQQVDKAINFYEKSVFDYSFAGSHPYTRLSILYKKYRTIEDEIIIIKKFLTIEKQTNKAVNFEKMLEQVLKREERQTKKNKI